MLLKSMFLAVTTTCITATALQAEIMIHGAYGRVATPVAKTGAMFMHIMNNSDTADRLISVSSVAAQRVELHTHKDTGDGVMQMMEVEAGFEIPAGGIYALERGGDHVMFMGLTARWAQGDMIPITLKFETAGEVTVEVIVDLTRAPGEMDHSTHGN